ncbi:MAG: phosphoglucosamine mutase [Alphaproteobacteria bacterium]|nr:phosphoglucosamine mutase [Alphaproteobacteria bacterium]
MMARKLFGTDGIRGKANTQPITADIALRLAQAAAIKFIRGDHRHLVIIGKDTRLSGYMLEPALTAGFISMGMDVILLGPLPTPAISMLTRSLRADLGVMISASHNAFEDNGIKLFGPDGFKLSDEMELSIEHHFFDEPQLLNHLAAPTSLGRAKRLDDARGRYIEFVKSSFPKGMRLDGLKIVVDCAHGAAYKVAPMVLWELGAEVIPLSVSPDGLNINKNCGVLHPKLLQEKVIESGADLGIALDGDADRLILCDEKGRILDGDQLLAMVAESWKNTNRLIGQGIVVTVMSNIGLELFLKNINLKTYRTAVGDRYVTDYMRKNGFNIGGEQSGHIIFLDYASTGDGLVAALQILSILKQSDKPASMAGKKFEPLPQELRSINYKGQLPLQHQQVKKAIESAEASLGKNSRIVIRPSGTEPVIRIMVEGEDPYKVSQAVNDIAEVIKQVS